jgi:hypothetical protein
VDVRRALAPSDELGESPFWPAAAILAAAGLYADLPSRFIVGHGGGAFGVIRWVVPALAVLILLTLGVVRPSGPLARALGWPSRTLRSSSTTSTSRSRTGRVQPDRHDAAQPLGEDAMLVESAISLSLAVMVVARAVNILATPTPS